MNDIPTEFGHKITCDRFVASNQASKAVGGSNYGLVMVDIATHDTDVAPSSYHATKDAVFALRDFVGPTTEVGEIRIDNAPELIAAAKSLGWRTNRRKPCHSQTNGILERNVGATEEGARTILDRSGFGLGVWNDAPPLLQHGPLCFKGHWD